MKKIFVLAVLALTLAACSKPESEIRPAENDGMITLTATLAPKGAATKALEIGQEWAIVEQDRERILKWEDAITCAYFNMRETGLVK